MLEVKLNTFDNSWYKPGRSKLHIYSWFFVNVLFFQNPLNFSSRSKIILLKLFGSQVGKRVLIKPSVSIKYPWKLTIGDDVWIGEKVWIDNLSDVTIGNNVCLSQGAFLLCGNHDYKKNSFDLMVGKIILEEGVWIGAKSIVCPGVRCESHSVLAINSVASCDLQPFFIYKGNPAVKIRSRV